MITDKTIRNRFIKCFHEVPETVKEKALRLNVNKNYISQLPNKKRPEIKGSLIANFCVIYHYSPVYILTGKGPKRGKLINSQVIQLSQQILEEIKELREKDAKIIHDLLSGMIELDVQFGGANRGLIRDAKKHIKN